MNIRTFLKECLLNFFMITTGITIVYATLGKAFYPEMQFGFEAFYSPLILGVISFLPSFILYSKKELNLRQTIIRKVLHLFAIETILVVYGLLIGGLMERSEIFMFLFSVFAVYLIVTIFNWLIERKDTVKINKALKRLQNRE